MTKEDDVAFYEKLPWKHVSSKEDEQEGQPPFKCNEENMMVKTENKVEEPIQVIRIQQLD